MHLYDNFRLTSFINHELFAEVQSPFWTKVGRYSLQKGFRCELISFVNKRNIILNLSSILISKSHPVPPRFRMLSTLSYNIYPCRHSENGTCFGSLSTSSSCHSFRTIRIFRKTRISFFFFFFFSEQGWRINSVELLWNFSEKWSKLRLK